MNWKRNPPYRAVSDFDAKYQGRCYCGAVVFEVSADPVDAKLCHCDACKSLHGAPLQWAVIFHKTDVRFTRGVDELYFYSAERGRPGHALPCKLSCVHCHSPIADEGRRMFLAFGPLFDFGPQRRVPEAFQPTCHIFYGARVIDIDDGKPKFVGHKGSERWDAGQ